MPTHKEAIQMVLDALVNPKTGAVKSLAEIDAVGHRVVHGGEKFSDSVVITEEVIAQVEVQRPRTSSQPCKYYRN